ncbi:hypothetical protein MJO29_005058 [Puccinia striiformis f. sp. tritici]|nr:hypothetical protein MJO29_005058 [Puccinia striiformis f. sp. tritici]
MDDLAILISLTSVFPRSDEGRLDQILEAVVMVVNEESSGLWQRSSWCFKFLIKIEFDLIYLDSEDFSLVKSDRTEEVRRDKSGYRT